MTGVGLELRHAGVIRLAECTYPEAARLARDERAVVILPLGAIEQHGPHLPLLVDWLGAEELARHVAPHLARAGYRVILAPTSRTARARSPRPGPAPSRSRRATLRRVIVEVIGSLARHGFRRFVLANYQADPAHVRRWPTRSGRSRAGAAGLGAGCASRSRVSARRREHGGHARPARAQAVAQPEPEGEWHSGELETALVLARRPDLVRRAVARRLPPVWVDFRAALRKGAKRFEEIAPGGLGYFGWPAAARAMTAERALALRGRLMAREIIRALAPPPPARRRPARSDQARE